MRIVRSPPQTRLGSLYSADSCILHEVIDAGHSASCPEAHLLPCAQYLKLNVVAHGSKAGDKVSVADAAFTKQYWALQQCPNQDVYANRLTQFCDKWTHTVSVAVLLFLHRKSIYQRLEFMKCHTKKCLSLFRLCCCLALSLSLSLSLSAHYGTRSLHCLPQTT